MIIDLCDSPIPKTSADLFEIDDEIEQEQSTSQFKSGLSNNVLKFVKSTSFSSSSMSAPSTREPTVGNTLTTSTSSVSKSKKAVKKQESTTTISDITNTTSITSSVTTAKPKFNPYKKNKYYNKSTSNTAITSSQASSSSSQSTDTTTAILTQDSQLTDPLLNINSISSAPTTTAANKKLKTKRTTSKHTSSSTNQPPPITTTATPKYPKNSNTYYSEVSITIHPSLVSSEHTLALLDKFAFDSTDLTLLTTPTASNNSTSKLSKKTKEKNLSILLQSIDQNKLRSLTDKSLFTLYINNNTASATSTTNSNSIPGLCLWNHRKIELGGRCRIGGHNSDLFPFVVIDYCPQKFVDLVFSDLG